MRFWKKVIGYFLFLAFSFLILEIVLSIFDPEQVMVKSFDRRVLFRFYPDRTGRILSEEYSVSVKTNSDGFRQSVSKENSYPILVFGDSFTEGWGVEASEVYVEVANSFLPKDKQIRNLGIHGASPSFYYLQFPFYYERFRPKTLILQIFDNDLDDNEKLEVFMDTSDPSGMYFPKPSLSVKIFGETISNFVKETTTYRLIKRIIFTIRKVPNPILYYREGKEPKIRVLTHEESIGKYGKLKPLGDQISTRYGGQFEFYSKPNNERWVSLLKKQRESLERLHGFCRDNGVELRILYVPAKEFFSASGITGDLKVFGLEFALERNPHWKLLNNFCRTHKLVCYDLVRTLANSDSERLYFPYDAHWNRNGHRVVGEYLFREIRKEYR
ncbi:GDSL-like protein [Leptospira weilii str. Ecochallenge]|uniref:GDSL-like protein n=1 Tax=Leptospira weilii str. Ecochallenge TaxID=1049986 RepID=N1U0K3_9LEPT|nr:GDSL-like protein [Leptospira weilii str. Ecochallenge]